MPMPLAGPSHPGPPHSTARAPHAHVHSPLALAASLTLPAAPASALSVIGNPANFTAVNDTGRSAGGLVDGSAVGQDAKCRHRAWCACDSHGDNHGDNHPLTLERESAQRMVGNVLDCQVVGLNAGPASLPMAAAAPEPRSWAMFAAGLLALVVLRRRSRQACRYSGSSMGVACPPHTHPLLPESIS
jgi:hypothetical protein